MRSKVHMCLTESFFFDNEGSTLNLLSATAN
jgi:hypothetical protein